MPKRYLDHPTGPIVGHRHRHAHRPGQQLMRTFMDEMELTKFGIVPTMSALGQPLFRRQGREWCVYEARLRLVYLPSQLDRLLLRVELLLLELRASRILQEVAR